MEFKSKNLKSDHTSLFSQSVLSYIGKFFFYVPVMVKIKSIMIRV